jgi:hypothetical protein
MALPLPFDTQGLPVVNAIAWVYGVAPAAAAAETSVAAAAVSTQLLAANANRKMFALRNDSDKNMYVAYGGAATTASVTQMAPTDYYEDTEPPWTGTVFAIWEAGVAGNARIREIT